jgi:hypothetical protein
LKILSLNDDKEIYKKKGVLKGDLWGFEFDKDNKCLVVYELNRTSVNIEVRKFDFYGDE